MSGTCVSVASRLRLRDLERLDEDRRVRAIEAVPSERLDEALLERQAEALEVGRVLRLGVDADGRAAPLGRARSSAATRAEQLLERGHARTGRRRRSRAAAGRRSRARSVLSSASVKSSVNQPVIEVPSIVFVVRRRAANSGRLATSVVPEISFSWRHDEDAVLRGHEVGLDEVGALLDRERVGRERVLGPLAARAAVGDHDRTVAAARRERAGHQQAGREQGRLVSFTRRSLAERSPWHEPSRPRGASFAGRLAAPNEEAHAARRVPLLLATLCLRRRGYAQAAGRRPQPPPPPRPRLARAWRSPCPAAGRAGSRTSARCARSRRPGIPVDAIAANSMGAVVGGIYATGRTAAELEADRALARLGVALQRPAGPAHAARRPAGDDRYALARGRRASTGRGLRLPGGLLAEHRVNRFLIENLSPAGYAVGGRLRPAARSRSGPSPRDLATGDPRDPREGRPRARGAGQHVDPARSSRRWTGRAASSSTAWS